jgi:7-cyano-7-deazaguanine reductase
MTWHNELHASPLGEKCLYLTEYTKSLLFPVLRSKSREPMGIGQGPLPFVGADVWNGFELTWLDLRGKPVVAVGTFVFPCTSPYVVESKSFKLYLNSFHMSRFESLMAVSRTIQADLSQAVEAPVHVELTLYHDYLPCLKPMSGECVDNLEVTCEHYHPEPKLLAVDDSGGKMSEALNSNLLMSTCPVTGQPDYASVWINYEGSRIVREALLKYLVSYRRHGDFHEACIERIFVDIMRECKPTKLTVCGKYTRRGGLDINPTRSTQQGEPSKRRLYRQ